MRCILFLLALLTTWTLSYAQQNISIYKTETSDGYVLYADNNEYCPVSVEIKFTLTNVESSSGEKFIFVLPAKTAKFKITELKIIRQNASSRLSYTTTANFGDVSLPGYDTSYYYTLPFKKGEKYTVSQGYNGKRTHKGENALDFEMPEGTEICAIRDGVVYEVVEKNNRNCTGKDCVKYNNYIRVYHSDGTMAEYTHLKKNGSLVIPGDSVKAGIVIGYSGNTGYSTAPHLHIVVRLCNFNKTPSVPTYFKTGDGKTTEILTEKNSYLRNY